jgi:hypothetical protein
MAIRNGGDDTRIETPTATDQATYLFSKFTAFAAR